MDYLEAVKLKEEEESLLYARMKQDTNLLYLAKYVIRDSKKMAVPDVINMTLNRPAVFAANVISSLGGTSQQTVVEAQKDSVDTHFIEEFQDAVYNAANTRLQKLKIQALNPFADIQLCIRGRTGRRVLCRDEEGILVPDIMPWDGRYVTYETGVDGLGWAAYKTTRTKARIEAEYGVLVNGKTGEVLDVWDTEHNEVWIDGKLQVDQAHPYGYTPVVIEGVSLGYGSALLDLDRIEHEHESIFFLIRDIIPEMNRLVTILQTLNMLAIKPPIKQKMKDGRTATPSDYDDVMSMGANTAIDAEGDIGPIDYGDAKEAAQMVYGILEKALQQGSMTDIDLGNLQFPLSAVALVEIGQGRDQVFLPRLQSKALLNQATAEMFTKQVLAIGGTIELGTPGHKRKFNTGKLEGEYGTTYKYFTKDQKSDIARMSIAEAASKWYPRKHIYTEVLQVEDPDGMEQDWYAQLAEQMSPNVMRHRIIEHLLERAEKEGDENAAREAKMLAAEIGQTVEGAMTGNLSAPQPIVPLMPKSGQVEAIPSSATRGG